MPAENIGLVGINHSRVDSYVSCRRKHWYGYVQALTKKEEAIALAGGTATHDVLATFYRYIMQAETTAGQRKLFTEAVAAARTRMIEIYAEGYVDDDTRNTQEYRLFEWYFKHEPFVKKGYLILAVEQSYNVRIDDEQSYHFTVDLIVREPGTKRVLVVDHKTAYDFMQAVTAQLLPQLPKYVGGLRALGLQADGGVYNEIRTRIIKGTKRKDGTYPGPTKEQMLNTFDVDLTDARIARSFEEQLEVADEIIRLSKMPEDRQDLLSFRSAGKHCGYCDFKTLCAAELRGEGAQTVRNAFYKPRPIKDGIPLNEDNLDD